MDTFKNMVVGIFALIVVFFAGWFGHSCVRETNSLNDTSKVVIKWRDSLVPGKSVYIHDTLPGQIIYRTKDHTILQDSTLITKIKYLQDEILKLCNVSKIEPPISYHDTIFMPPLLIQKWHIENQALTGIWSFDLKTAAERIRIQDSLIYINVPEKVLWWDHAWVGGIGGAAIVYLIFRAVK